MIVGVLAVGASIVLGFFAFILLATLLASFAAIIGIRVWWYRRKLQRGGATTRRPTQGGESKAVIEGEFRVVDDGRDPVSSNRHEAR